MALGDLISWNRLRAPVTHRESMSPLVAFQDQVNRLFDDFWRGVDGNGPLMGASFGYPRVEMSESAAEVEEDKVSASFKKGILTVRLPKSRQALDKVKRISINGK